MKVPWPRSQHNTGRAVAQRDLGTRALLISIQPKFAKAILDGSKTIELRRTSPTLPPAALALIYSSSPSKALVGWATVDEVLQASPSALWNSHSGSTGISRAEFTNYFAGRSNAYGLRLSGVERAGNAIGLTHLRDHGLEPPQSWRYVAIDLAETLQREMQAVSGAVTHREMVGPVGRTGSPSCVPVRAH